MPQTRQIKIKQKFRFFLLLNPKKQKMKNIQMEKLRLFFRIFIYIKVLII